MCLAVPLKVLSVNYPMATVDLYGGTLDISLLLLPEEVAVGDYVLVHAGFAIQKMDEAAASETLGLLKELAQGSNQEPGLESRS